MHFSEDSMHFALSIRNYQAGRLTTYSAEFCTPVVFFQNQALTTLLPSTWSDLNETHFQALADLNPELILLGTGPSQHFCHPQLLEPLHKKRIGIEVMHTDAACRTFNLLLSEGRPVLAALFI